MALELSPMTEADLPTYTNIDLAAFADHPLTAVLWPHGRSPTDQAHLTARTRQTFLSDPTAHLLKVTDPGTGTIIAVAEWHRCPARDDDDQPSSNKANNEPSSTPKPSGEDPMPTEWAPGANVRAKEFFIGTFHRTHAEVMRGRAHWLLSVLVTRPEAQGRGAGGMLVRWGVERADEEAWPCYLEASERGKPLYERFGFRGVKSMEMDLGPWGREGVWVRNTGMVREAGGSAS
ncbi:MAG: hypothetical protein M1821_007742 [Bathelium mastoideum]|nr:MAG: hypothetical protein M1821_007742 [Bathelium mastoideum]